MRGDLLRRLFTQSAPPERAPVPVGSVQPQATTETAGMPFGEYGEKGEKLGEQLTNFAARLEELESLRRDFSSVASPVRDFIISHAEAQTRLSEANALLACEEEDARSTRAEAMALRSSSAQLENALAEANNQIRLYKQTADDNETRLKSMSIAYEDARSRLDWATRQLAIEAQNQRGSQSRAPRSRRGPQQTRSGACAS